MMLGSRCVMKCTFAATVLISASSAIPTQVRSITANASDSLNTFIASESAVAFQAVLDNIGPDGAKAPGAGSGIVIASPDWYPFTWTRDSAKTMKALIDLYIAGEHSLKKTIENYTIAQAKLQTTPNYSGNLSTGGLGEPIFAGNGSAFDAYWVKRPQRDGPALRATALTAYANHLISTGKQEIATSIIWPIISNDLSYIAEYWNQTGFDLWENTNGTSFFGLNAQHRALTEGGALAHALGQECKGCAVAPQLLCLLQDFWDGEKIVPHINANTSRSGIDASSILSSIQVFDPSARSCDSPTFQPCSDRALSNHKIVVDAFRSLYGINRDNVPGNGVAVGRYPEDTSQGGNPWYITTSAAAEQLYDALYQWQHIGCIEITSTSLAFWKDLDAGITVGTYNSNSAVYQSLTKAVREYADGFMAVVEKYTPSDGTLSEQFAKDTGAPKSAGRLTWSYVGFLTAVARREGGVPEAWNAPGFEGVPSQCVATTVEGSYVTPTNVVFPS